MLHRIVRAARGLLAAVAVMMSATAWSQTVHGPYDVELLQGGTGLEKALPADAAPLRAGADWTLRGWIKPLEAGDGRVLIAGVGDVHGPARYFAIDRGRLAFWSGGERWLHSSAKLRVGRWQALAAVTRGGRLDLYLDGRRVAQGDLLAEALAPKLVFGPQAQAWPQARHFGGLIAGFTLDGAVRDETALQQWAKQPPDEALTRFEAASPQWPVQVRQMYGMTRPQDAWTLPKSRAPLSTPQAKPEPKTQGLAPQGDAEWNLDRWWLASASELGEADGAALSRTGYAQGKTWYTATVPGTVLTTLVDRGVYPDPDFGLNNMAIPESLNQHDWWYRSEFDAPAALDGKRLQLNFDGINYVAKIWLNGEYLGETRGAFIRGVFDVTSKLRPGARNALAVQVSPPQHPGIPHEQSMTAGVGDNGGMQALDGPTFIASEGWDWIPAVRDRNTGLWQGVRLTASGAATLGDAHVVTAKLSADHRRADIEIEVPVTNRGDDAIEGEVVAAFDDVRVSRHVAIAPGETKTVKLTPAEFAQLSLRDPRLWWPNGYGEAALHELDLQFVVDGAVSDRRSLRFGIRTVTYELSLFDDDGRLRRVEVDLAKARERGERVVDVRHEAIRKTPGGWAASLQPGALESPAVHELSDERLAPHLVIRVNGVRIAAKGGNWGTDDWRKRVSRERLEPYFRLQRAAHMNVVRNWVGQNTEEVFFDLADEHGLMVLNDFWASTQDFQLEPQDEALFVANASDVIRRYRHHPSIVLWFGRNEGVPQPWLNEELDRIVAELDGTRYYSGSSNSVNLAGSGPYNYREPETYFTEHARGFSVEVGTPSFATREAFAAMVEPADLWPIGDAWAYHDWHQSGNGDTATFMRAMADRLGEAKDFADFERKAQLLNYDSHRAIFEGMNAHLWSKNSGRLLWMSHPAWPSNMWQIYSHDYDTHAAYYAVKKAAEPVHVQMNLPEHGLALVNNTRQALRGVEVEASVHAADGRVLQQSRRRVDAAAGAVAGAEGLDLAGVLAQEGVVYVKLRAIHGGGTLSENFYWVAHDAAASRQRLAALPQVTLDAQAQAQADGNTVRVRLRNSSQTVALVAKLTLVDAEGKRILPAFADDNYVNLLPGESRDVTIACDRVAALQGGAVMLRGWNVAETSLPLAAR
ncbi:LamG-like jellyroll fold domain-containing protein [Lysobacter cavernae]|uniref:LamG-like jellyroll fold domain-containing protein n=1 Tax=Lysobacter cavernae TaxID=1685901 RepID=A0ABV7RQT8_9GAMM